MSGRAVAASTYTAGPAGRLERFFAPGTRCVPVLDAHEPVLKEKLDGECGPEESLHLRVLTLKLGRRDLAVVVRVEKVDDRVGALLLFLLAAADAPMNQRTDLVLVQVPERRGEVVS